MNEPKFNQLGAEKLVVTQDGQRVGGAHNSLAEANEAAKARKTLAEASGNTAPQVRVVQQLNG